MGNTVRSCSYAPGWDHSAIAVYVGGSFRGMPGPEADAQLNQGIVIANNAVYASGAAAIAVTNSRDVVIADNVITDTNVGGFAAGSIFLNAVSAGGYERSACIMPDTSTLIKQSCEHQDPAASTSRADCRHPSGGQRFCGDGREHGSSSN